MRLEELVEDESTRREYFPIVTEQIYFANASVAPIHREVARAMEGYIRRSLLDNQERGETDERFQQCRALSAKLLGCGEDEIALIGPTSLGLSFVANGLDWAPGDEIVGYFDDYPANVYPWLGLQSKGVKFVSVQPETPGAITWDVVEAALTEKTKLVALASCNFLTGYRIDVDEIGRNLHERGVLFCLDGIQTLGAFPLSVEHVDFMSADSHKWLLGPCGAGVFYVSRELHERLTPIALGSGNVVSPDFVAQSELVYEAGARRYEPGTMNLVGILGLGAAIEFVLELGVEQIAERLLRIRTRLVDGLRPLGFEIYGERPDTPSSLSTIVTLDHPKRAGDKLFAHLQSKKIAASLRRNRDGKRFVRLSPHYYNTFEEIDEVIQAFSP